jgi:hypothetical protein
MPAPKKQASVGDVDIQRFRAKLKDVLEASRNITINFDEVEADLDRIASKLPEAPRLIRGEKDMLAAQRVVTSTQALRTRLVQHQQACERAKTTITQLLDLARGWVKSDPWVASLKNEAQREHVLARVTPGLVKKSARVAGCLREIDHLLWGLKDNQGAILIQINAWKEETWAHRQGIE